MTAATRTVTVVGDLTIQTAAEQKPLLLGGIDGAADVEFDLSDVSEIDTAGLQLLLCAGREAGGLGVRARVGATSQAVAEVLALLAVDRELGSAGASA